MYKLSPKICLRSRMNFRRRSFPVYRPKPIYDSAQLRRFYAHVLHNFPSKYTRTSSVTYSTGLFFYAQWHYSGVSWLGGFSIPFSPAPISTLQNATAKSYLIRQKFFAGGSSPSHLLVSVGDNRFSHPTRLYSLPLSRLISALCHSLSDLHKVGAASREKLAKANFFNQIFIDDSCWYEERSRMLICLDRFSSHPAILKFDEKT